MKAYITQKDICVSQGFNTVFQGTMYIPEAHIQIDRDHNYQFHNLQIQPFDAYMFRVVQSEPDALEEFEVDEEEIHRLLTKKSNLELAKKDLEETLRDLYKNILPQ